MTEVSEKKVTEKGTKSFTCVDEMHHIPVVCSERKVFHVIPGSLHISRSWPDCGKIN